MNYSRIGLFIPLPPRASASGGEGLGVGGSFSETLPRQIPPTPTAVAYARRPTLPAAARGEGKEK